MPLFDIYYERSRSLYYPYNFNKENFAIIFDISIAHCIQIWRTSCGAAYILVCTTTYPYYQRDFLSEGVKFKLNNTESYTCRRLLIYWLQEKTCGSDLVPSLLLLRSCFVSTHKYPDRRSTFYLMNNTLVFH